jgi:hypothetical protein
VRIALRSGVAAALLLGLCVCALAQDAKAPGVLPPDQLKKIVPAAFFYRGQSASVQLRNSVGVRTKDEKYILAGLVDTSGYASDIAQKYQGFLISEVKLDIEGSSLPPGEYGFGFTGDKLVVTDVGANDVLSVAFKTDTNLKRAVPLKIVEDNGTYKLYAGKKWVELKVQ